MENRSARRSTRPSLHGAPFTAAFIAVCVLVFLAGFLSPSAYELIFLRFSQINAAVGAGEWWRLLTAAFLHSNPVHIVFNMWALLLFGPPLERRLGSLSFAALCFACAIWGGAAAYLLTDPRSGLVGASGAIFGVFGVWLYVSYLSRETPLGQEQFRSLVTLLAINAFISFAVPRVSWQGHAGGLAAGLLITALWRRLGARTTPLRRTLVAASAAAAAIAVVLLSPLPPGAVRRARAAGALAAPPAGDADRARFLATGNAAMTRACRRRASPPFTSSAVCPAPARPRTPSA
jgi:membrane associated rhomboid family serine protease